MPGLVSTLLNQAYSTPSREVHTFLQVIEQVWQPMHLSRFRTIAIWARTFMAFLGNGEWGIGNRWKLAAVCAGEVAWLGASCSGDSRLPIPDSRLLPIQPVDSVHLADDDEFVAVGADRAVVV